MRPHGRANIDAKRPRALAICQRCGFRYNHDRLRWQFQWGGARLINQRILVCPTCYDTPQEQLRTIILPPDPVPIEYPVPENFALDDNPMSPIGFSLAGQLFGTSIGNLTNNGGLDAAFDGHIGKYTWNSAGIVTSNTGFQNFIGKNWNGRISGVGVPPQLTTLISFEIASFSVYSPKDSGFILVTRDVFDQTVFDTNVFDTGPAIVNGLQLQGSNDNVAWTVLYNTTFANTPGEVITSVSSSLTGGNYQYHRIAIQGNSDPIAIDQVQFNVTTTGRTE